MEEIEILTSLNHLQVLVEMVEVMEVLVEVVEVTEVLVEVVEVMEVLVEVVEDVEVDRRALRPFQPPLSRTVHSEESWEDFPTIPIHS